MNRPGLLRRLVGVLRSRSPIVDVPACKLVCGDLLVPGGELGVRPDGDQVRAAKAVRFGTYDRIVLTTFAGGRWILAPEFPVPAYACSRKEH